MLSDVIDLIADTAEVDSAVAVAAAYATTIRGLTWPGTDVVSVSDDASVAEVLQAVETTGAHAVAIVACDVPDLPSLMLGKLFSAMAGPRGASVAVCPAEAGGLVALAAMVPVSGWLRQLSVRFDDEDAMAQLLAGAPLTELSIAPGWHRVRTADDLTRLDPGLEGWDATRAYVHDTM
jgi:2-phospho-L-lactate guanylyltransferase (CobY/MobA/RfbA family)